jgi:hypothetical protein
VRGLVHKDTSTYLLTAYWSYLRHRQSGSGERSIDLALLASRYICEAFVMLGTSLPVSPRALRPVFAMRKRFGTSLGLVLGSIAL